LSLIQLLTFCHQPDWCASCAKLLKLQQNMQNPKLINDKMTTRHELDSAHSKIHLTDRHMASKLYNNNNRWVHFCCMIYNTCFIWL